MSLNVLDVLKKEAGISLQSVQKEPEYEYLKWAGGDYNLYFNKGVDFSKLVVFFKEYNYDVTVDANDNHIYIKSNNSEDCIQTEFSVTDEEFLESLEEMKEISDSDSCLENVEKISKFNIEHFIKAGTENEAKFVALLAFYISNENKDVLLFDSYNGEYLDSKRLQELFIEELKCESQQYIKSHLSTYLFYQKYYKAILLFHRKVNEVISDELYDELVKNYDNIEEIKKGRKTGSLTPNEIVKITEKFLYSISEELGHKFKNKLEDHSIAIDKRISSKCVYFSRDVNGEKIHDNIIGIQYTGTAYDIVVLVHEFFHSLTDIINYKQEIKMGKIKLNYIQEAISIFAEFVCADYLESLYPNIRKEIIFDRLFSENYLNFKCLEIMLYYLKVVMEVNSIDELKKRLYAKGLNFGELVGRIQSKEPLMSIEHFLGTVVSIAKIVEEKEANKLLNQIFEKINNEEIEEIFEMLPMTVNTPKVIEYIKKEDACENTIKP